MNLFKFDETPLLSHADGVFRTKLQSPIYRWLTWLLLAAPLAMVAQGDSTIDTGDTAWILVATALVLFMNIPGLALFYAGLVRGKNVLSVLMHCFVLTATMTILWLIC